MLVGLVNGSALAHHPCGRPDGLELAGGRAADHGIAPGVVRGLFVGVGVGVGVAVVVGVEVGDGDGLLDPGDDNGELPGRGGAGGDDPGAGPTPPWPLGVLLGAVGVVLVWVTDGVLEPVRVPEPLG